jgi:hypothetical protein
MNNNKWLTVSEILENCKNKKSIDSMGSTTHHGTSCGRHGGQSSAVVSAIFENGQPIEQELSVLFVQYEIRMSALLRFV